MTTYYSVKTGSYTGDITLNETISGTENSDVLSASNQITKYVSISSSTEGNVFEINSARQPVLKLDIGRTYIFDQSDPSNKHHQIKFSQTFDGVHNGGDAYSFGVSAVGVPGEHGAYTKLVISSNPPVNLSYYCKPLGDG